MNTQTLTKFSELRRMAQLIQRSINTGYLEENWRDLIYYNHVRNYEDIIMTESGYYAHTDDCALIDDEYYHKELDGDEIRWDEIDEEYILEDDARVVLNNRGEFYTHVENCICPISSTVIRRIQLTHLCGHIGLKKTIPNN